MSDNPPRYPLEGLVLVVDDDAHRRAAKLRLFAEIGHLSVLGATLVECLEVARVVSPDVIVIEPDTNGDVPAAARELLAQGPMVQCVILGAERARQARDQLPEFAARLHGVNEPASAEALRSIVRRRVPTALLAPFSPVECVQAAGLGGHSVSLDCVDGAGVPLGSIHLLEGRVLAAHTEGASGFEAFSRLVTHAGARAILAPPVGVPAQADLNGDWQFLVLEAMRRHDHAQRFGVQSERNGSRVAAPDQTEASPASSRTAQPTDGRVSVPASIAPANVGEPPALNSPAPDAAPTPPMTRAMIGNLVEQAVRAVVARDYPLAISTLERVLSVDPDNRFARHRLERLYALRTEWGH